MPTFTLQITNGFPSWIDAEDVFAWAKNHDGGVFDATLKELGKHADPKTAEQLGIYWGLWLPAILRQMRQDGQTATVPVCGRAVQMTLTRDILPEALTAACGMIGPGGEARRLSQCDKHDCRKFLDHVVMVGAQLGLDLVAMAERTQTKGE